MWYESSNIQFLDTHKLFSPLIDHSFATDYIHKAVQLTFLCAIILCTRPWSCEVTSDQSQEWSDFSGTNEVLYRIGGGIISVGQATC